MLSADEVEKITDYLEKDTGCDVNMNRYIINFLLMICDFNTFKNFNILLTLNYRYWKIHSMSSEPVLSQTSEGISVQDDAEASRETKQYKMYVFTLMKYG